MLNQARFVAASLVALILAPALAAESGGAPATAKNSASACREPLTYAATARKPQIERGPATPGDATAWYAVDRREDGCRRLVKLGNPAVSQPEPPREEGMVVGTQRR